LVKSLGSALEFIPESFRKDKDIVLAAMSSSGLAMKYASLELQNQREVVLAAVS